MRRRLHLVDTTLRDGEQAAGVVFAQTDRRNIARALVVAGVSELEVGIPAMGPEAIRDIRDIAQTVGTHRIVTWCRGTEADLAAARACGVAAVHLSFPASPLHQKIWGCAPAAVLASLGELVSEAKRHFSRVYVGAQDASRAEPGFLLQLAQTAAAAGAQRLRYADTVGRLAPAQIGPILAPLLAAAPALEIEFHAHNDLGLATANTLAAYDAGVHAASVTVNGLGERAGNAALEEVVMALQVAYELHGPVNCVRLAALCDLVANAARRPLHVQKPVVGTGAFLHESGIHCAGLLRDTRSYEPFAPAAVGRSRPEFVLGRNTGSAAVSAVLRRLGMELAPEQARRLSALVRTLAQQRGGPLSPDELRALARPA